MLVLMSPLATCEMTKLMVEAVLLWRSSKCGDTECILATQKNTNNINLKEQHLCFSVCCTLEVLSAPTWVQGS